MSGKDSREEIKDLLRNVRNEVQKFSKDLASATQKAVDSTEQAARRVSPRITETFDTSLKEASTSFRRVMGRSIAKLRISRSRFFGPTSRFSKNRPTPSRND